MVTSVHSPVVSSLTGTGDQLMHMLAEERHVVSLAQTKDEVSQLLGLDLEVEAASEDRMGVEVHGVVYVQPPQRQLGPLHLEPPRGARE